MDSTTPDHYRNMSAYFAQDCRWLEREDRTAYWTMENASGDMRNALQDPDRRVRRGGLKQ